MVRAYISERLCIAKCYDGKHMKTVDLLQPDLIRKKILEREAATRRPACSMLSLHRDEQKMVAGLIQLDDHHHGGTRMDVHEAIF